MLKKMTVVLGLAATVLAVACGGGGGQSTECKDWLTCLDKTPGGMSSTYDSSYGSSGTCWTTTTAAADACTTACKSSLAALKTAYPDAGCN